MNNVNKDILMKIISFLPFKDNNVLLHNLAIIDKEWKNAVYETSFTNSTELNAYITNIKLKTLNDPNERLELIEYLTCIKEHNLIMIAKGFFGDKIVIAVEEQEWKRLENILAILENRSANVCPALWSYVEEYDDDDDDSNLLSYVKECDDY